MVLSPRSIEILKEMLARYEAKLEQSDVDADENKDVSAATDEPNVKTNTVADISSDTDIDIDIDIDTDIDIDIDIDTSNY